MKTGAELIVEERSRQLEKEGWTPEHDDQHDDNGLARAASCYTEHYIQRSWVIGTANDDYQTEEPPDHWPWVEKDWKPKDPLRDLVRAGALIAAEIDRLLRIKS